MNEIIKAIEERRSIRRFKSELPKEEDIAQIVEAGLYAASGRGRQATLTIAVTNKARGTESPRQTAKSAAGTRALTRFTARR